MTLSNVNRVAFSAFGVCALSFQANAQEPVAKPEAQYGSYEAAVERWLVLNKVDSANLASSAAVATNSNAMDAVEFSGSSALFEADPSTVDGSKPTLDDEMLRLAKTMGVLRNQLKAAGYSRAIFETPIEAFEVRATQELKAGQPNPVLSEISMQSLVAAINESRLKTDPSLPPVQLAAYSAASYTVERSPVILQSDPEGGRIWVIPQLRFEVCRQTVANPYDTVKCTQWKEADDQIPMYLVGTYAYQIHWRNGRKITGQRTIYSLGSKEPVRYRLP